MADTYEPDTIRNYIEEAWNTDEVPYHVYSTICDMSDELENRMQNMEKLMHFFLGCLVKGHVACDTCGFRYDDICGAGKEIIREAKRLHINMDDYDIEKYL